MRMVPSFHQVSFKSLASMEEIPDKKKIVQLNIVNNSTQRFYGISLLNLMIHSLRNGSNDFILASERNKGVQTVQSKYYIVNFWGFHTVNVK